MTVSLYDRLGGYDALAVFATQVVERAQKHDELARFWLNRNEDTNARDLQSLIDFLVNATGGQMYYRGRDMALAHKGMGITAHDWECFIGIVVSVAGEMGVREAEGGEVMGFLDTLKDDIVSA
ncbi:group 1 truncated hemoglobin [Octadecabacter sp. 1_MG-2023]|uniref:group I truncated hemoglobin n=1 Tax=unclassified Octadecabacter TaxID=196158 RepID=UPI001C09A4E2|nr:MULTISPECIES: group 1 truncated hemoglobin [unclassified Octadecabacter]MBU2991586.1 group 1 truncated hemoglobin [Octadecabacter sp. B2R22]MDO6736224.1 group 1 truncated hemoglobin [Octadecabacter sp. 1_MG-2023]